MANAVSKFLGFWFLCFRLFEIVYGFDIVYGCFGVNG